MIKVFKDGQPYKEFYSIYNTIEFLQKNVFWISEPEVVYSGEKRMDFQAGPHTFAVELEFSTQTIILSKWVDGYLNLFEEETEENLEEFQ